ncbi:ClbS/DfsB family four-helix bundle protein [Lactococcus protaetiae]|uniref:ClbS/DfsB family four-helix bundle protein n=2 Tax=Lactococcus protaetiae TaxID=2592653 RepID=A0A514Z870_9LACT|nr:ClbS/DfsB family four-helix bundle protein [Lactococcus protaetiae]
MRYSRRENIMKTPTAKAELLQTIQNDFDNLIHLIDSLPEESKNAAFRFNYAMTPNWRRDTNVRSVLMHLYERANRLVNWLENSNRSATRPFRADFFGDMSPELWIKQQNTDFEVAYQLAKETHKKAMSLLETLSEDELFKGVYFTWKSSLSIADYAMSGLANHYKWLRAQIENQVIVNEVISK